MKDVGGTVLAGSSPPFLGRERAAVDVDVGPERRSPRYHETCLALESIKQGSAAVSEPRCVWLRVHIFKDLERERRLLLRAEEKKKGRVKSRSPTIKTQSQYHHIGIHPCHGLKTRLSQSSDTCVSQGSDSFLQKIPTNSAKKYDDDWWSMNPSELGKYVSCYPRKQTNESKIQHCHPYNGGAGVIPTDGAVIRRLQLGFQRVRTLHFGAIVDGRLDKRFQKH